MRSRMIRRSAHIHRLTPDQRRGSLARAQPPPKIDGKLDDAVWQAVKPLDPLVGYATLKDSKPKATTLAWVTYDDQNLYIAFQCAEPKKGQMRILGEKRDDSVWEGDSLDVFLSKGPAPTPYVHLILSPRNVQWDALYTDGNDMSFNPKWESATVMGDKEWTAELAIPWAEVGIAAPRPGTTLRANLCRQRIPDREQTCWSQTINGFMEEKNLGEWVFE